MKLRAAAKALVESAIGRDIKRMKSSIALIDRRQRHKAWFSYDTQLQWFLDANEVDLVIDVGANQGQFAKRLRHTYVGEIISFEPVSAAFARLARAAATNPRWTVHHCALGQDRYHSHDPRGPEYVFSSLLVTNDFSRQRFQYSAAHSQESVHVKRLDDVLTPVISRTSPRRLFLKLDTQGYDLEVFNGLGQYADQVIVMQSELSLIPIYEGMPHWQAECIAVYEQAGLHVAGMCPGLARRRRADHRVRTACWCEGRHTRPPHLCLHDVSRVSLAVPGLASRCDDGGLRHGRTIGAARWTTTRR